jgi:type VI secretion system protein ImpH
VASQDGIEGAGVSETLPVLFREPWRFEFPQAMRLLTRKPWKDWPAMGPGWRFSPDADPVRIGVHTSLSFPASEIFSLYRSEAGMAHLKIAFFGLTGFAGALPTYYSEEILRQALRKDLALEDFFDLFNHRAAYLYYYAWQRYRFAVEYERAGIDPAERLLTAFAGHSSLERVGPDDWAASVHSRYSSLLALQARSSMALRQILRDFFQAPIEVQELVGGWYRLDPESLTRLDDEVRDNAALGFGAVAGEEYWDVESSIRVVAGPLSRDEFERFLPGGEYIESLRYLCRLFCRDSWSVDVRLVLDRAEVPNFALDPSNERPVRLGWTTWARRSEFLYDPEDVTFRLLD